MRAALLVGAVAGLVCLAGCQSSSTGQPGPAVSNSSPITSLGRASGTALRFRPVKADVAGATGTGAGADRQGTDPNTQQAALAALDCAHDDPDPLAGKDDPTKPLVTCAVDGKSKYVLGPAFLTGADVADVRVAADPNGAGFVIDLTFKSAGARTWADYTGQNVDSQVAFVVNARVVFAPSINQAIPGGNTQISGNFTRDQADQLAHQIAGR